MSLVIDSNTEYLQRLLGISAVKFQEQYAEMSVEDIIEAEASQGNQMAITLAKEILNDVNLVIKLFDLADANNKLMILTELNSQELQKFFPEMVNKCILDSIKYHMFPLTVIPPHYIEGWIVTSMDKKASVSVLKDFKELPNYVGIRTHKVGKN